MEKETGSSLLDEVKNYLDITWDDPDGDSKLEGIIGQGKAFVQRLTTRGLKFEEGTAERMLLFEYCMYARGGALSDFPKNYLAFINTFQADEAAKAAKASKEGGGEG